MQEQIIETILNYVKDPKHGRVPVLESPTGTGKSATVKEAAKRANLTHVILSGELVASGDNVLLSICTNPQALYEIEVLKNYGENSVEIRKIRNAIFAAIDTNAVPIVLTMVPQKDVPRGVVVTSYYDGELEMVVDTVTEKSIDEMIQRGYFDKQALAQIIIMIGNEALNPKDTYESLIGELMRPREGRMEFYFKDTDGNWIPDSRIVKLGNYINEKGGFAAMQEIFELVMSKYKGSESNLEKAWNGIGEWEC